MVLFLSSCASQLELEERAALREAYGGCRLTLKSIRAQNKTTDAIRRNGLDNNRFCNRFYCW